jgi:anti-sigma B factor antagonist
VAWLTVTGYGERLEAQTVADLPPYEGMAPVGDPGSGPGPAVVALPAEIDMANADDVGEQLRSAFTPGVTMVVADLTLTVFCDSYGMRALVLARRCAAAHQAQLRLVVSHPSVLQVLTLAGLDRLLPVYPSLGAALTDGPLV